MLEAKQLRESSDIASVATPCFRYEVASSGKDVRPLQRFDEFELLKWASSLKSSGARDRVRAVAEHLLAAILSKATLRPDGTIKIPEAAECRILGKPPPELRVNIK